MFEEYCKDADIALGDETQKIFFNTNGTDNENVTPELRQFFAYLKNSTEEVANMQNDERIQKIHERVKYIKRNRELEAGYMTMEEYIHEEAGRRAKKMAQSMAQDIEQNIAQDMASSRFASWLKLAARSETIEEFQSKM